VYNQGNNKESIFFERDNYLYFLSKMKGHLTSLTDILAWCLMPNHFHWLIRVNEQYPDKTVFHNKGKKVNPLNRAIGTLQSSYTQAINKKYERTGSPFRTRTKAKSLSEDEKDIDNYGIRAGTLCQKKLARDLFDLPEDPEAFKTISQQTISDQVIQKLY
jgi:REP element-mobilizing transposase RayT